MEVGEGRSRRSRGTAIATAGGGTANCPLVAATAATPILTSHRLLSVGRSARGSMMGRTQTRPSNTNGNHRDNSGHVGGSSSRRLSSGYTNSRGDRHGDIIATGVMPTLQEASNQAEPSSANTTNNINNTSGSGSQGAQRVARYIRDANCSCESCTLRSSGRAEIKKWQVSDAKAHLRDILSNNKQHKYWHDPPAKVYDANRTLFHLYKYENFSNNIRSLKKGITSEQSNVDFDEAALERESIAFPRAPLTSHGNPYYDTSETKKLLVELAKEGGLEQYKHRPSILKKTNPIFNEYQGKVFAKAVNREKRRVREAVGWQMKRNIQGSKKHNSKYDKVQAEVGED